MNRHMFVRSVCSLSVALRLPTAYRSETGSGKGREEEEEGRFEGLEGAGDVGGMTLEKGKTVVVI